ncbi:MAG TPA: hypothetical protein DCQ50_00725 [Chryseobacterium sp.]|nr:hypothetical protein [Chryseobacterium sp.]
MCNIEDKYKKEIRIRKIFHGGITNFKRFTEKAKVSHSEIVDLKRGETNFRIINNPTSLYFTDSQFNTGWNIKFISFVNNANTNGTGFFHFRSNGIAHNFMVKVYLEEQFAINGGETIGEQSKVFSSFW